MNIPVIALCAYFPAGANVIWLDQPAGAGFSYSDKKGYDSNQAEVSADVYRFLQARELLVLC